MTSMTTRQLTGVNDVYQARLLLAPDRVARPACQGAEVRLGGGGEVERADVAVTAHPVGRDRQHVLALAVGPGELEGVSPGVRENFAARRHSLVPESAQHHALRAGPAHW